MTGSPRLEASSLSDYRLVRVIEDTEQTTSAIAHSPEGQAVFVKARDDLPPIAREAAILEEVSHPQIPSLIRADLGESSEHPFIVTEMMPGNRYVIRWIRDYPVPWLAARLCVSALKPLGHLHERGFTHRDVKTSNLVIKFSGEAALVDFELGLHKGEKDFQPDGRVQGTADYMAPERAYGYRGDGKTDIYAMGIVMYELLFGKLPFLGEPREVANSHVAGEIDLSDPYDRHIPEALKVVINKATQKQPSDRYESAEAMSDAIESACSK